MNEELKKRLSNFISWLGFGYPILLITSVIYEAITNDRSLFWILSFSGWHTYSSEDFFISIIIYCSCAAINYLMIGKPRFFPFNIHNFMENDKQQNMKVDGAKKAENLDKNPKPELIVMGIQGVGAILLFFAAISITKLFLAFLRETF